LVIQLIGFSVGHGMSCAIVSCLVGIATSDGRLSAVGAFASSARQGWWVSCICEQPIGQNEAVRRHLRQSS